jgi:hypothetical protein
VTCYYYRSSKTLEEYIQDVTDGKMVVNRKLLDELRTKLKEQMSDAVVA